MAESRRKFLRGLHVTLTGIFVLSVCAAVSASGVRSVGKRSQLPSLASTSRKPLAAPLDLNKGTATTNQVNRPNIVYLLADDLGYASVGYNGGDAETPNLDAMAADEHSIELQFSYSGGPQCSPTRGTLLTGRNHNRYCLFNVEEQRLRDSEETIAEILSDEGYHTVLLGKWHLGELAETTPGDHGFEEWWSPDETGGSYPGNVNYNCACYNESACYLGHWGAPRGGRTVPCKNYYGVDETTSWKQEAYPQLIEDDDSLFIADRFALFLERLNTSGDGKPFFAYLAFHAVHTNYVAHEKYRTVYESKGYDDEKVDYYGALSAMDEAVGKVRELLRTYNIENNTMVVFASDNGVKADSTGGDESTAYGLTGSKGDLYEGGIRGPGIIEWPAQISENRETRFPVVSSDLLPTVLDILGLDAPEDVVIDGTSLMPMIRGETDVRDESIAWLYEITSLSRQDEYRVALRRQRYKFIGVYNHTQDFQEGYLYEVITDESESVDLAADKPTLFNSMREELEAWQSSVMESINNTTNCTNVFQENALFFM